MITLYYDNSCILCTTNAITMQQKAPNKITIIPKDDAIDLLAKYNITELDIMTYVVVQDEFGQMHKGMNAVRLLYKTANIPFHSLLYFPIIKQISNVIYPIIAKNRYRTPKWLIRLIYGRVANSCENGVCHIDPKLRANIKENQAENK
ncbi:thiol-disulfide oxidoreductase DCC family protein [Moraxella oblonga]|uniref:thiol-disulfide oxidoreductase DCC family protein n=1 Tax=Moraxella oblonga TaxID=200413 RepID=UPI00082DA53E|nr:DUF393 domain-containing protein [Moraxella oblonga]